MKDCTFCRIYTQREEVIYQNDLFFAQWDKYPVSPGHVEVIPKRHVVSLLELTEQEWASLQPAISEVVQLIEATDFQALYQRLSASPLNDKSAQFCRDMLINIGINKKPDAYNHGVNDGAAAGRTVHHLHWHIIPRYSGDVADCIGGVRHIIPDKGNYRK